MKVSRINGWLLAVVALLGVIAFTSTSVAGEACDNAFHSLMTFFFGRLPSRRVAGAMHFVAEKGVHFTLFLALSMLLLKTMPDSRWKTPRVLSLALLVGIASELLQTLFPGRDPAVRDVFIDLSGAVAGVALHWILQQRSLTASGSSPWSRPAPTVSGIVKHENACDIVNTR